MSEPVAAAPQSASQASADLPPALSRWSAQLTLLQPELRPVIGDAAQALASALLPRLRKHGRVQTEPDGFAGIHRRGSPEHLLLTEWALAQEIPLEFLRRAAMSEQFYLQRALRDEPEQHCFTVLLDCGPAMLGSPRLVQLTALILLEQFTVAQSTTSAKPTRPPNVTMRFGCLQSPHEPLVQGFGMAQVRRWIEMRSTEPVTVAHISTWQGVLSRTSYDSENQVTEQLASQQRGSQKRSAKVQRFETVYIVRGSATPSRLFEENDDFDIKASWGRDTQLIDLCVDESLLEARALDIVIRSMQAKPVVRSEVSLTLPSDEEIVTMLRRPLAPRSREARAGAKHVVSDTAARSLNPNVQILIHAGVNRVVVRQASGAVFEYALSKDGLTNEPQRLDKAGETVVAVAYSFTGETQVIVTADMPDIHDPPAEVLSYRNGQQVSAQSFKQLEVRLFNDGTSPVWCDFYSHKKAGFLIDTASACWSLHDQVHWGAKLMFKGHQTIDELIERQRRLQQKVSNGLLTESFVRAPRSRRVNSLHYQLPLLKDDGEPNHSMLGFFYRRNMQEFSIREVFSTVGILGNRGVWYGTHTEGSVVLGLCYLDDDGDLIDRLETPKQAGVVVYALHERRPQVIALRNNRKPLVLADASTLNAVCAIAWEATSNTLVWVEPSEQVHVKRIYDPIR
jgi:hypothetical protein